MQGKSVGTHQKLFVFFPVRWVGEFAVVFLWLLIAVLVDNKLLVCLLCCLITLLFDCLIA
jgi:hypothetical protein